MRVSGNSRMTDAQSKAFGAEMKRLRKEAKLSTADFAKYMGISQAYVCNLESASRKPSPELAKRIADAFDSTVDEMCIPHSEKIAEERRAYGKKIREARRAKGYSVNLVAGALGIPPTVYNEYELGLCSITDRNIVTLNNLLDIGKPKAEPKEEPKTEPKAEKVASETPTEICDIILEHITDLKVDKDTQKKVWHYFSRLKLEAEERRLFG